MALVKLSRDVIFSKDAMPICLPGSDQFPDEKGEVHVAGWGMDTEDQCTTGKYGPNPYTRCAPTFIYNDMTINTCVTIPPPSSNIKLCKNLVREMKLSVFPEPGYTQTDIYDEKGQLLTECFNHPIKNEGTHGWCATCNINATRGEPGFCGLGPLMNLESQFARPTNTKGWGFCEKQCSPLYIQNRPAQNMLKEVDLQILSVEECKKMGQSLEVMTDIELCAAKQVLSYFFV